MKIFNFLKTWRNKSRDPLREVKGYFPMGGFVDYLTEYGHTDLAAYASVELYCRTSAFWSAVDIIAEELSSLIPVVKDKQNDEVIKDHPVLDLLGSPGPMCGRNEFLYSVSSFFLITGNSYVSITGDIRREPLEISSVYPQTITPMRSANDGFIGVFLANTTNGTREYKREEVSNRFRFYYIDEAELWQIKKFNPNPDALGGQTPASAILPELDWFNASATHNNSLLKRGARPSGILINNTAKSGGESIEPLTEEQYQRLKEQLGRFQGASNAGKPMFFEGANMKWENLLTSNRDMDFLKGRQHVRQIVYTQYRIPLPLIEGERQTFSNMGSANDQLYDNAVLPNADRIFGELDKAIMPRYKGSEKLYLTYDDSVIPALKNRKTKEVQDKGKTGIYTINELRTFAGMEPLDKGGDMLYRPASMVPISQDLNTEDQFLEPQKTSKKRFRAHLLRKGYSEEKIEEMSVVLGLR